MQSRIHALAGGLALLLISTFFLSSLTAEIVGHPVGIIQVKRLIVYGLTLLIPAMAITGITGRLLAGVRRGQLMQTKQRRMLIIALNGLLILTPCALVLANLAENGHIHGVFYAVQGLELIAGGVNIALLSLNMRDGLRLTGRLRKGGALAGQQETSS